MDIKSFLKQEKITEYKFSEIAGVPKQNLNYYTKKGGVPNKETMKKIYFATNKLVTPNGIFGIKNWEEDFYNHQQPKEKK